MTAPKPDTSLPIGVHGDLRLDSPSGGRLILKAEGSQLHLAVPRWSDMHGLGPRSLLAQRRALVTTVRALRKLSLTLSIDVAGQRALGLGAGARTTLLARLLGLTSADIRWPTVINLLRARAAAA